MLRSELLIPDVAPPATAIAQAGEQRCEQRRDAAGQRATLFVRGVAYGALVGNISESGAMIKASARPLVDDHVVIAFDGCTPIHASVRWAKDGRIGLQFGPVLLLA